MDSKYRTVAFDDLHLTVEEAYAQCESIPRCAYDYSTRVKWRASIVHLYFIYLAMSIQMSLVFGALVAQMSFLILLLLPLPYVVRTSILDTYSVIRKNTNVKVGFNFALLLLGLQFFDCVKKLQRYSNVQSPYFAQMQQQMTGGQLLYDQLASKFYAQRNLYITGAVLYLSLAINTVYSILVKLVKKETDYRNLVKEGALKSGGGASQNEKESVDHYQKLLAQREKDIETLKKQLQGMQNAYDSLNETTERSKDD